MDGKVLLTIVAGYVSGRLLCAPESRGVDHVLYGPAFLQRSRGSGRLAMRLITPPAIRTLQRKLYVKAKAEPAYRFYRLYERHPLGPLPVVVQPGLRQSSRRRAWIATGQCCPSCLRQSPIAALDVSRPDPRSRVVHVGARSSGRRPGLARRRVRCAREAPLWGASVAAAVYSLTHAPLGSASGDRSGEGGWRQASPGSHCQIAPRGLRREPLCRANLKESLA